MVTPRLFFETVVAKGYAGLVDEGAEVTLDQALAASRELSKLLAGGDDTARWAQVHATQQRIIRVMREVVPPEYHQAILDVLDGRSAPPPGGARPALGEGGVASDDEFDTLEGDEDDEDFDDD